LQPYSSNRSEMDESRFLVVLGYFGVDSRDY
jgi:hypothetical protein